MNWPEIKNLESIASPGLLVDPDRVAANIQTMIAMVGGADCVGRLRPHVKTHKMPEVVRLQVAAGIQKFKAATIAEADMVAAAGGQDVLLAYQLVGPNIARFANLIQRYPNTLFSTLVDDVGVVETIAEQIGDSQRPVCLFIDVDCGMHRTGIEPGDEMERLRQRIESLAGLKYGGLHVYDGHLHQPDLGERQLAATAIIATIRDCEAVNPSPTIVGGGSPTFASWAKETAWECSPGTPVFWDVGYGDSYPDLEFQKAIALLTRVISKPAANRICLDLGYKAVASEMPLEKRVTIPAIDDAKFVGHSEEHLVIETSHANKICIGQPFLAFPRHICPTVALHALATVVRGGRATDEVWRVTARDR
jgi:D-serine deaminase-like pyridoxal phosphate-dependent protein